MGVKRISTIARTVARKIKATDPPGEIFRSDRNLPERSPLTMEEWLEEHNVQQANRSMFELERLGTTAIEMEKFPPGKYTSTGRTKYFGVSNIEICKSLVKVTHGHL